MTSKSAKNYLSRRAALLGTLSLCATPRLASALSAIEITWEDLIPPGVPEPVLNTDYWVPFYDESATKFNDVLDGAFIKIAGFVLPLESTPEGVSSFVLVPYVGACIHVPPPPPNQLVFVTVDTPWPISDIWDAVWVTGIMKTQFQSTEFADTGYALTADKIEAYEW